MTCSLIITTYNWPEALEFTLLSTFKQSTLPSEIIIADDGSTEVTAQLIEKMQELSPVPLIHSWQEDQGFRLARSRNFAISKSSSKYIIIVDGDMILHKHFIKGHLNCSNKDSFLQGSRVILNDIYSKKLLQNKNTNVNIFSSHVKNTLNGIYLPLFSKLICKKNRRTHKGIRGCNFSFFKDDILKVNGFNEDFTTWGREDSEFVERLYNVGLHRKNLKFGGIQFHIYHNESSSNSGNDAILQKAIDEKLTWCENGIDKHL